MEIYNVGQQPCKEFKVWEDSDTGYSEVRKHSCWCGYKAGLECEGHVVFCGNCHTDHHSNGYESCVCKGKGFISEPANNQ